MKATIKIFADCEEWDYGTYDFDTNEQKNRVNEIAMKIREERTIDVEVVESEEK